MTTQELRQILDDHKAWARGDGGKRADLTDADLRGADLTGANLDFSCWPLWCGSLGTKADGRLVSQLLFHLCSLDVSGADAETKATVASLRGRKDSTRFADEYRTELVPNWKNKEAGR